MGQHPLSQCVTRIPPVNKPQDIDCNPPFRRFSKSFSFWNSFRFLFITAMHPSSVIKSNEQHKYTNTQTHKYLIQHPEPFPRQKRPISFVLDVLTLQLPHYWLWCSALSAAAPKIMFTLLPRSLLGINKIPELYRKMRKHC